MNNPHPKFSIITVTYNAGKVLEDTIQSVVFQTYRNVEYIIVDGGSTDNTLDVVHKYQQRHPNGNRRLPMFLECR